MSALFLCNVYLWIGCKSIYELYFMGDATQLSVPEIFSLTLSAYLAPHKIAHCAFDRKIAIDGRFFPITCGLLCSGWSATIPRACSRRVKMRETRVRVVSPPVTLGGSSPQWQSAAPPLFGKFCLKLSDERHAYICVFAVAKQLQRTPHMLPSFSARPICCRLFRCCFKLCFSFWELVLVSAQVGPGCSNC